MLRLKTLLLSSNQICMVTDEVATKLLSLDTLVLNNNKIGEFEEIEGLKECSKLQYLSLMDNPITKKPHYRLTLISMLPQLRCIDFRKVTQAEREAASDLIDGESTETTKAKTTRGRKAPAATKKETTGPAPKRKKLAKIKTEILAADSVEEISRLEKILESGYNL